jgi:hypothetical protein
MSIQSTLKRLLKAVPVVVAAVPTLLDAFKEVKAAVKKEKPQPPAPEAQA